MSSLHGSLDVLMRFGAAMLRSSKAPGKFDALFGMPARKSESQLEQVHVDLAASIQKVTEDVMLKTARHAHKVTGKKNLCLAGGVALNGVANGKLARAKFFDALFVPPAPGDAGGALGAALFVHHQLLGHPRVTTGRDTLRGGLAEVPSLVAKRGEVSAKLRIIATVSMTLSMPGAAVSCSARRAACAISS